MVIGRLVPGLLASKSGCGAHASAAPWAHYQGAEASGQADSDAKANDGGAAVTQQRRAAGKASAEWRAGKRFGVAAKRRVAADRAGASAAGCLRSPEEHDECRDAGDHDQPITQNHERTVEPKAADR
eukprot:1956917-Prymnesium_polylepis.2